MNNIFVDLQRAWSNWEHWSQCSGSCGPGTQITSRICDGEVPVSQGGIPCDGSAQKFQACENDNACPGISFLQNNIYLKL